MKKRMAIIATAFMLGTTMANAQVQEMEDSQSSEFSKQNIRDGNVSLEDGMRQQVESLNQQANLELSDEQKNELVTKMVSYQEAQLSMHRQFQEDMKMAQQAFEKEISDTLTADQRDDLEAYEEKQRIEREQRMRKMAEEQMSEFEKARQRKIESGEITAEDLERSPHHQEKMKNQ